MHGAPHLLLLSTYLVLLGTAFVTTRRKRKASCLFEWRGRHGLLVITVTWKEMRIYRNWWPVVLADDTPSLRFRRWRWPYAPFSNERTPADTTHYSWGGLLYARGENTETRTRYRVISIPHWLPLLTTVVVLTPSALRSFVALLPSDS